MTIKKLDNLTIEKIAAGEVIESPASIVKELVENSIDAQASQITVEIKNGGKNYIRVTDNGIGIDKDQLKIAFDKHTTSKLMKFEDLYDIYSLGFRGEALSSIVIVSDVVAISKTSDSTVGKKIVFKDNNIDEKSIATNNGTSIEVTNLFKNLPARRRFLKTDIIEANNISKLMYALAIGYKDIVFKYIKDGRIEFQTNLNEPPQIRISNLLDENLNDNLIQINKSNEIYKINGYISSPNYYRGNRSLQYIYVNNRLIENSSIISAVEREYRSYIPNNRFPAIFIFIETNPKNLDINIHPNKKFIKFSYEEELLDVITKAIYDKLSNFLEPNRIKIEEKSNNELLDFNNYTSILEKYNPSSFIREENEKYENKDFFDTKFDIKNVQDRKISDKNDERIISDSFIDITDTITYITTVYSKYSLFIKEDEILIMDHRRADENIKYHKFVSDLENKSILSQLLLEPISINLKGGDRERFKEKKGYINDLGFDVELFGEDKIIIRSTPFIFQNPENYDFIYSLLDIDYKNKSEAFYKDLYKLTKKFSFRKGHSIGKNEAITLIKDLFKLDNPYKTYEGKTILVTLDKDTMEKYFER